MKLMKVGKKIKIDSKLLHTLHGNKHFICQE